MYYVLLVSIIWRHLAMILGCLPFKVTTGTAYVVCIMDQLIMDDERCKTCDHHNTLVRQLRRRYRKIYEDYRPGTMFWKEVLLFRYAYSQHELRCTYWNQP
jgi:hypothetical protein